jgi:hypothetical protein
MLARRDYLVTKCAAHNMRPAFDDEQPQRASRFYFLDLHGPLKKEQMFHNIRGCKSL